MNFNYLKTQLGLIIILLYNIVYNLIPFFSLKRIYLRITGTKIGKQSYVHIWVRFTWFGRIKIGDNTTINFGCLLDPRYEIEIGNNVMIGHHCKIYTAGHDIDDPMFVQKGGKVTIEDDCVIFPNVLIMPNVYIHKGSVILPGSVVTKDVDSYSVVGGNPCCFIRKRKEDLKYKLNYGFWFINS